MLPSLNWDLVRVFLVVAEAGSLSKASASLRLSQSTVGRQIDELESQLGVLLLLRTPRGTQLTEQGQELAQVASSVGDGMEQFLRIATGTQSALAGTVRVAATEIVGIGLLIPMLAKLQDVHKQIDVELVLDNRPANLLRGEADISVRMFPPAEMDLVGSRVGELPTGLYASKEYLKKYGHPKSRHDLLNHRLIGFDSRGPFATYFENVDSTLSPDQFSFRTDSLIAHLEAARHGAGIAGLQIEIAARYPELLRVLPKLAVPSLPLWLVMHKDVRRGAHVRAMYDGLKVQLSNYLLTLP